jgi:DNA-binding transcriptional regulator WhiA
VQNREFFDIIDTQEKAYWLGFFYADGSLWKNGKQLSILLSQNDIEHLQKFAAIFELPVKVYYLKPDKRTGKTYSHARVLISSKHMWI